MFASDLTRTLPRTHVQARLEQLGCAVEALERVPAERAHAIGPCCGHRLGREKAAPQPLGEGRQPRGAIARGADDREVEPRRTADIAVGDLAQIERGHEIERVAGSTPLAVELAQALAAR